MSTTAITDTVAIVLAAIVERRQRMSKPLVVGICGAQGSGKSTLAQALVGRLREGGVRAAVLSLDDLYLTQAERMALAATVHPLLCTRGVPGTHDISLGLSILERLDAGLPLSLPRFDKARDDRAPVAQFDSAPAGTQVLILEGWCVGALPQPAAALVRPVNELERTADPSGAWRQFVNRNLAGSYQVLFARLDMLILLAAPGFEVVGEWRIEQEHTLARTADARASRVMSDAEVMHFIQFYERITRHILEEMPDRSDLVVRLDSRRGAVAVTARD
jgi:D-glycerate 3-kinase